MEHQSDPVRKLTGRLRPIRRNRRRSGQFLDSLGFLQIDECPVSNPKAHSLNDRYGGAKLPKKLGALHGPWLLSSEDRPNGLQDRNCTIQDRDCTNDKCSE